jgi:hypothetical protein
VRPTAGPAVVRPDVWAVLEAALVERRTVRVVYHGHARVICPHALGWKAGRAKVLAYQAAGTTSGGGLPADPRQRWRSMFVDEIEQPVMIDRPWQTSENYTPTHNGIDRLELDVNTHSRSDRSHTAAQ